jgi:hypothetical protein
VDWASDDECGCGPGVSLTEAKTTGQLTADDGLSVYQLLSGAALDAEGDAAWQLTADVHASLTASDGTLDMGFTLVQDGAETPFAGSGTVTAFSGDASAGEAVSFLISGTYGIVGPDQDQSPIRVSGGFTALLKVWSDASTVYELSIWLSP